MPDPTQLLYLEPDDEITSVVRRLREADGERVVLVAPGRSKATTSAVALRLLAGVAAEEGRQVALVADPAGRALAAEAGIAAFPSVTDASVEGAVAPEPPPARRAPIRVVRGDEARVATTPLPVLAPPSLADETVVAPVAAAPPRAAPRPAARAAPAGHARRRILPRVLAVIALLLLVAAVAAGAVVAPAASITIQPSRVAIEPVIYTLELPPDGVDQGELTAEAEGQATGIFRDPSPAIGTVVFSNWNTVDVEVPAGTRVAAGEIVFATLETIVVPIGFFSPFAPGEESVDVAAVTPGPSGNVAADAIDTILDPEVRAFLRGLPDNPNRLVRNPDPTAGGSDNEQPRITRRDVDRAADAIRGDLQSQLEEVLAEEQGVLYVPAEIGRPRIEIPPDLVGRRGEEAFTLSGSLAYIRAQIQQAVVEEAAIERLLADETVVPADRAIAEDTIRVVIERVTRRGEDLEARVRVTAAADPVLDHDTIRSRVDGMTEQEAEAALSSLGAVDVALWPDWVDRVPDISWRVSVEVR
jgi:hypothetical protein